jgi:hypothetical protein
MTQPNAAENKACLERKKLFETLSNVIFYKHVFTEAAYSRLIISRHKMAIQLNNKPLQLPVHKILHQENQVAW